MPIGRKAAPARFKAYLHARASQPCLLPLWRVDCNSKLTIIHDLRAAYFANARHIPFSGCLFDKTMQGNAQRRLKVMLRASKLCTTHSKVRVKTMQLTKDCRKTDLCMYRCFPCAGRRLCDPPDFSSFSNHRHPPLFCHHHHRHRSRPRHFGPHCYHLRRHHRRLQARVWKTIRWSAPLGPTTA